MKKENEIRKMYEECVNAVERNEAREESISSHAVDQSYWGKIWLRIVLDD